MRHVYSGSAVVFHGGSVVCPLHEQKAVKRFLLLRECSLNNKHCLLLIAYYSNGKWKILMFLLTIAVMEPVWWWKWYLIISLFSLNQFSCSFVSDSLQPNGLQHSRLPCPSPSPGAYSDSCPSSWWCYPTILSSFPPTFNLSQHQSLF